jgi:hypothetical protein
LTKFPALGGIAGNPVVFWHLPQKETIFLKNAKAHDTGKKKVWLREHTYGEKRGKRPECFQMIFRQGCQPVDNAAISDEGCFRIVYYYPVQYSILCEW